MPKVSTASFRIDGEICRFDIAYSKKTKFEVKGFPEQVLELGKESDESIYQLRSQYSTEEELVNKLKSIVEKYHERKATSRKVILFNIKATSEISMNKVGEGSYSGRKPGFSDKVLLIHGERGSGVVVDYKVAMEVHRNGLRYNVLDENGSVRHEINSKDYQLIEWTEQREAAFKEIAFGMERMVKRMCSVLCDDDKLLTFLDSGVNLLPEAVQG